MPVSAGSIFSSQPVSAVKVIRPSDSDIKAARVDHLVEILRSRPSPRIYPSASQHILAAIERHGLPNSSDGTPNSSASASQHILAAIERHGLPNSSDGTPNSSDGTPNSSGSVPVPSGPSASSLDYYNAEISKLYGMDKNVAYQEALANTAYQRAVKDMQAAGLNPASLFGAGRASPADGVGYVGASGGSSGGRSSAAGAAARSEYRMSKSDYTKLSGICAVIGTAAGAAAGYFIPGLTVTSGATLGGIASQGVAKIISQW